MSTAQLTALLVLALAQPRPAAPPGSAVPAESSPAWIRLKGLAGTWERSDGPAGTGFRIRYRLISAGTALVEEFGDPARHYCAQGNQPRLRRRQGTSMETLVFDFLDATNLRSPADSHLVRLTLRWLDPDHLSREEVYAAHGKEEASTLLLQRAR